MREHDFLYYNHNAYWNNKSKNIRGATKPTHNKNNPNQLGSFFSLHLQLSRLTLLTKLICTPSLRCDPEHSRQQKAPIFSAPGGLPGGGTINDAHRGCRSGQSEQTWFSGRFIKTWSRFFSCACDAMVVVCFSFSLPSSFCLLFCLSVPCCLDPFCFSCLLCSC